jgi:4'-phosphopantetheinyl transferase
MPPQQLNWPQPSPNWPPHGREHHAHSLDVQVWETSLDLPPGTIQMLEPVVAPSELDRASRFHFARDRNRFIAGRGFMRMVLGNYLGAKPGALEFIYNRRGKPALGGDHSAAGLHFNLSHSEDLALLAISPAGAIGVDVEHVRPMEEVDVLVKRFFSPGEIAAFQTVPAREKFPAFFRLWTRKEAFLKATGEGIAHLLDQVEVSFLPDEPARLLNLPQQLGRAGDWQLHDLAPAAGFAAALAVPVGTAAPVCQSWVFGI